MPNAFAYIAIFFWPFVAAVLFRLLPRPQAITYSIVGAYLFLPEGAYVDLPMVPALDKHSIPAVFTLLFCWLHGRNARAREILMARHGPMRAAVRAKETRSRLVTALLIAVLVFPWVTAMQNRDPVIAGPTVIPGLRIYDSVALIGNLGVLLIPFVLGMRYLGTAETQLRLLRGLVIMASGYAFLVLFEARMSPQLNVWVYGFFPHDWLQHMRAGGFRPIVFLSHGLWLAIFIATAFLAAVVLWRNKHEDGTTLTRSALLKVAWLAVTLIFCRSLGALLIAVVVTAILYLTRPRTQFKVAALVCAAVLVYPMLRSAGLTPIDAITDFAESIEPERAQSFSFRVHHEDMLLDKALEKPVGGWGTWGRNRVFDPETGEDLSVTDGFWVLVLGQYGWLGYVTVFGLLTLPTVLLWNSRRAEVSGVTAGVALILAANVVDLIPNATASPVTWLIAGSMAGIYSSFLQKRCSSIGQVKNE